MFNTIKEHIESLQLFSSSDSLLLAVSGGVDSMVMADLIDKMGFVFSVAHVNHNTRSGASGRDRDFVNEHFKIKGVEVHNLDYHHTTGNFHSQAHKARYKWFSELGYDKILTAHHKDDSLETVLVNFFNGRSLEGILESNDKVVRPMLPFTKEKIINYAEQNSVPYIEDVSNMDNVYLRNLVRNKILPIISQKDNIAQKIQNLSKRITQDQVLLEELMEDQVTVIKDKYHLRLPLAQLENKSDTFLYHALSLYGVNRSQAGNLKEMLVSVGKEIHTDSHYILVDRNDLIIRTKDDSSQVKLTVKLDLLPTTVSYGKYNLTFKEVSEMPQSISSEQGCFPRKLLANELTVRSWESGDYFHPYGMDGKKKKLKKLFSDMKVDRLTKFALPIILNEDEIIWVPTLRSDERYKVSSGDRDLLLVEISS